MKKGTRAAVLIALLLLVLATAGWLYVEDYYHAENFVMEGMSPYASVTVTEQTADRVYVVRPEQEDPECQAGVVFYPGGKVQAESYLPLLQALAAKGMVCVMPVMPCNLAVLHYDAAEECRELAPEVTEWYLMGHSLGGAMAAYYVGGHTEEYDGLVLLAAYSTSNLNASGLKVMTIYGTEDGVMNRKNYEKNRGNLPDDFREVVLEGACHAGFGCYGAQKGDGVPTMTGLEQIELAAEHIVSFVKE